MGLPARTRAGRATGAPPWSWASAPIWAHVSGYAPRFRGSAGLAFLRAFIDDSAAQSGDRRLFMAGYLHRADVWADFSEAWHYELQAWPSIQYFKAKEANNLDGEFHYKKGWDEAKRNMKMSQLAAIIEHFSPFSFQFSVNRKLFEEELKPHSPYGFRQPHFQLSHVVVGGIARSAAQQGITEPIEFIFDEQDGVSSDVAMFFEDMMQEMPEDAKKLIAGTPFFKNDRDRRYMPLQAADLLVWHIRREHETGLALPLTKSLVNKDAHLVSEITDDMVRGWASHHSKQAGISSIQSKPQWRKFKNFVQEMRDVGINPARVKRPGIYYPDRWGILGRALEVLRRLLGR